jgi:arylsulfatase
MNMTKQIITWSFFLVSLFLISFVSQAEVKPLTGSRPNIIFVLTDDQSMGDLACMGNPILKTPHIDRFYKQSTRFTDFHVSPTCSPTRSALMSGRRPFEVGVSHTVLRRERMALDVVTLPQTLKAAGYATALFGKCHLGDETDYRPQNRGFDEVLMFGGGGIGQYRWGDFAANTNNPYFDNTLLHNESVVKTRGYCTDLFFNAALAWIKRQQEAGAPYFATISLNVPHGPRIAPESYKKRFLEMGFDDTAAGRYGMIENMDDNMGRMMAKLSEWGSLENTLVIFMTDNGSNKPLGKQDGTEVPAFNAGMRGGKNSPFEGGTRVPSFWYWKNVLPEGVDIPALTRHIDIYPTFCQLAGAELPAGKLQPNGRSLVPLLENPQTDWPERKLFIHCGRWGQGRTSLATREASKYHGVAVRTPRWRLVFEVVDGQPVTTLSDISVDPGETTNVAEQHPEVVQELKSAFDQWWDFTGPYLINEGLPNKPPEQQPLTVLYEKQMREKGFIPDWAPGEF